MAVIKVPTSFNIDVEFEIPEFYRRLVALLIDWALIVLYFILATYLLSDYAREAMFDDEEYFTLQALWTAMMVPPLLYFPLMEITTNGRSAGKAVMHLRVINENGGKPNIGQFMIRWLLRDIWFVLLLFFAFSIGQSDFKAIGYFILIASIIYFIAEVVFVASGWAICWHIRSLYKPMRVETLRTPYSRKWNQLISPLIRRSCNSATATSMPSKAFSPPPEGKMILTWPPMQPTGSKPI